MTEITEPKLMDRMRGRLRCKHYCIRTERASCDWVKRYIIFHGKRHPKDLSAQDLESYLTNLAVKGKVSALSPMETA